MNTPAIAASNVPVHPAPVPGAVVPVHLRGTRAAIFYLLRAAQAQKEAARSPGPAAFGEVITQVKATPARVRRPAPANGTNLQEFFVADHFEFRSVTF